MPRLGGRGIHGGAARAGTELIPVDSEHSAAFQALAGAEPESIESIVLTASGGPFRTWDADRLARATPEEAVRHPELVDGREDLRRFARP